MKEKICNLVVGQVFKFSFDDEFDYEITDINHITKKVYYRKIDSIFTSSYPANYFLTVIIPQYFVKQLTLF